MATNHQPKNKFLLLKHFRLKTLSLTVVALSQGLLVAVQRTITFLPIHIDYQKVPLLQLTNM